VEPGADYKLVCEEIELYEEVTVGGDRNTGHGNTGHRNTGDRNTGDRNTGDSNTGHGNTGHSNTGYRNTGYGNTGYDNTGYRNTGDRNTGDSNTGDGNQGNFHSGSLNYGEAPIYMFNKITKVPRADIPWYLVAQLSSLLTKDNSFDPAPFLSIPNATAKAIKKLHDEHIKARKALAEG
jgi:hypothetical protein